MRIPGLKAARVLPAWLKSRFAHRAVILAYHRVAEVDSDPYSLCVRPRYFAEQLELLRREAQPVSLSELMQGLVNRNLPRRAVAVTFDDGYADNLWNAKPLLERYDIPATVFAVAGNLGREFWWDELDRLLPAREKLPSTLRLTINGASYGWVRDRHLDVALGAAGRLGSLFPDPRRRLLKGLHGRLRTLGEPERQTVMRQLWDWAGTVPQNIETCREMTARELNELVDGALIEVGAHTVTHPVLQSLPLRRQQQEIQESKRRLEDLLGRPVTSFSYPYGALSQDTPRLVAEAGFTGACSSFIDAARYGSAPFQLPRLWVRDHDGKRFSRFLRRWLS